MAMAALMKVIGRKESNMNRGITHVKMGENIKGSSKKE